MTLGERIKACRQNAGMSQEKVAELVGVSRQAVTKWEANQSAPNTENLFKLAGVLGTSVDMLLAFEDKARQSPAEQIYYFYEKEAAFQKHTQKRNILIALLIAIGYLGIYLIGRMIWCDLSQSNLIGWLFTTIPSGEHSYLYGWLLSSNMFWYTMAISVIPAFFGKHKFSYITLIGFVFGLLAGLIFGPNPEGVAFGHGHHGWAIWGAIYFVSIVAGIIIERYKKADSKPTE